MMLSMMTQPSKHTHSPKWLLTNRLCAHAWSRTSYVSQFFYEGTGLARDGERFNEVIVTMYL